MMKEKTLEVTALYEISKILGSSLNLTSTLKSSMKVLSDYLEMQRATVALIEDEVLVVKAAYGLTVEEIKLGRYRLGEGIMGKVAKSGYPVVIPDVGEEPLFLNKTGARKDIRKDNIAFLCVPIQFGKEILGVLTVDRLFGPAVRTFDEDLRLLKIIASLIAQSVKLCRQVKREKERLIAERDELKMALKGKYKIDNMIGSSARMEEVFEAVHRVAGSKATVLLMGESGTGKELVARAIHYMGKRAEGPFIKLNCASIPEGLLETELFGHEKGAFTGALSSRKGRFELADKGTIFLDEVGDLGLSLQPKILRVLQEREFERIGGEKTIKVDVRVISATSRNLEQYVQEGRFREDLFYRLNVVPLCLPPLRDRGDDVHLLISHFLDKYNKENQRTVSLSAEAACCLAEYPWPGNVRELENTIERLVVMSRLEVAELGDLPAKMREPARTAPRQGSRPGVTLLQAERQTIIEALDRSGWVLAKAAALLGITPRQIGYKVKKYGIGKDLS